jgi:alkanesulfonate monooxygenase SsuD/methylene tetrahydromethanopterin reductase-like flavin-dependent oxidoreductase (luciferase family)
MVEEICMLDHLSHGRLEVGVGRGVSPYELSFHTVAHDDSRDIFVDAFNCISAGLTTDTLTYRGKHFVYENVPIALRPLQQPHPPFWYASSSAIGATWAGAQGLHFVTLGPTRSTKASIDAYRDALAKRGAPAQPKPEFAGGAVIGLSRYIFVAESDADARRIAAPALEAHVAHVKWLATRPGDTGLTSRLNLSFGASYENAVADGTVIAGTPEQVLIEIERHARHQLSPKLSLPRQYDARRRVALARSVQHRGHAAPGEALTVIPGRRGAASREPISAGLSYGSRPSPHSAWNDAVIQCPPSSRPSRSPRSASGCGMAMTL